MISLYAIGDGLISPVGPGGKLTTAPLPKPGQTVRATFGGIDAQVQYAGTHRDR